MFFKNKSATPKIEPQAQIKDDYMYLKVKVDFYERSNRILHTYQGNRDEIMKMYAELLTHILNYPVTLIVHLGKQILTYGHPFPYTEEYSENLANIKPFMMVASQNYPVMTFPNGYLVWHNPNYIYTHDEDLLYTAAYQISLVDENLRYVESVADLSITDPLTGLNNRRHLMDCLEKEASRAKRHDMTFGFLMLDIDHFKSYNDTYGHQEGDRALKALADILQEHLRTEDIKARYGGEEFCVILPQGDESALEKVAEKIRAMVERKLKPPFTKRLITVSVGGAMFPKSADNIEELIRIADNRLYRAKESGRNKVICAGTEEAEQA